MARSEQCTSLQLGRPGGSLSEVEARRKGGCREGWAPCWLSAYSGQEALCLTTRLHASQARPSRQGILAADTDVMSAHLQLPAQHGAGHCGSVHLQHGSIGMQRAMPATGSGSHLRAWPLSACKAHNCPGMQGLSFPAIAWMACHRTLIMGTLIARFIPHKLAPSIFPGEALPPGLFLCAVNNTRSLPKRNGGTDAAHGWRDRL